MTTRKLPAIQAFRPQVGIEWEPPAEASNLYTPSVKAAHEDERSINVFGRIGEDPFGEGGVTERLVSAALRRMGSGPVTVNINSRGGDFFAGVAVYNLFREHDGEVTTRIIGLAASAASVIAMASDRLLIGKAATLMIHNSHGVVIGGAEDMEDAAALFKKWNGAMAGVYSDRSGIDRDKIAEMMAKGRGMGTFFTGEEAVKNGLADELLSNDEVSNDNEVSNEFAALRARARAVLRDSGEFSRKQCRALVTGEDGDMPRAVSDVTPRADDEAIAAAMRQITQTIKRGKGR